MLYSSGGRPATALSPMFGIVLPSYSHTSMPSRWTLFGANSFHLLGKVVVEQRRGLDDVVVHADEDEIFRLHDDPPGSLLTPASP